jgi:hypothetical protein
MVLASAGTPRNIGLRAKLPGHAMGPSGCEWLDVKTLAKTLSKIMRGDSVNPVSAYMK